MADDPLVAAAVAVRRRAYAPYSGFRVGAAVRADDGSIHASCNVENAAYPEGTCAEAGAISAMIAAGRQRIAEVVVAGGEGAACTPCGGCRQKIREFAQADILIRMVDAEGAPLLVRTLGALLPDSFGPTNLGR